MFWETFSRFGAKSVIFSLFAPKVHFSHFLPQKCYFLNFQLKSRFSAQKVTLGAKVRFGSSGSPRRGPGTAPDGSPEGASPGTPPNPARARKRLNSQLNGAKLPRDGVAVINKARINSAPAGEPGDPPGRPRRTLPPFPLKVHFWGFWAEKCTLGAF